jgi:DNA polymerase-3 subunit epsilon
MREIVLDTETTGLDPFDGHRILEIGCVELVGYVATGRVYHCYLNPDRDVPPDSTAVHGLTNAFLADKPRFGQQVDAFLEFLADAPLVIHNADFDLKFLNAELKSVGYKPLTNKVTDTVLVARKKFPGQPANLDALCRRFKIDLSERTLHGALLDSQLLAEVYLELMGGRQQGLALVDERSGDASSVTSAPSIAPVTRATRPARSFQVTADEQAAHEQMIASLGDQALWRQWGSNT